MTVRELIKSLQRIENEGHGQDQVVIFDADWQEYNNVSGLEIAGPKNIAINYEERK